MKVEKTWHSLSRQFSYATAAAAKNRPRLTNDKLAQKEEINRWEAQNLERGAKITDIYITWNVRRSAVAFVVVVLTWQ